MLEGDETRKTRAARGRDCYAYLVAGLACAAAVCLGRALICERQRRAKRAWTSRARLAYLLYPNLTPGRRVLCVQAEHFRWYSCRHVIFACLARRLCALDAAFLSSAVCSVENGSATEYRFAASPHPAPTPTG